MGEEENSSVDAALVTSACLCPRPAPFSTDSRAVNRVLGNLVVEEDPAFGGGHLLVSGKSRARLHGSCGCLSVYGLGNHHVRRMSLTHVLSICCRQQDRHTAIFNGC